MYTICESGALWRPEESVEFLGTIVTDIVSYHMGAGNDTHSLCKGSQCSKPQSRVSSLSVCLDVLFLNNLNL